MVGRGRHRSADPMVDALTHHASGMMTVQTRCTLGDALIWMTARASETGETLAEIARAVIDGRLNFTP